MPRLPPSLFRHAKRQSPHLATLLPACHDLESARNELRWIKDHVDETCKHYKPRRVEELCRQRGKGVPLQYVLGSQPFGALDLKCKPGVLIPRPETEAYTFHLIDLIKSGRLLGSRVDHNKHGLNLIDFCTGTGCIPLLLFSALQRLVKDLHVHGVDISPCAIQLAEENIARNLELGNISEPGTEQSLTISKADIFSNGDIQRLTGSRWDLLISNPPYISRDVWNHGRGQLGYSVRKYEPRLALIPDNHLPRPIGCSPEDVFYSRLLDISSLLRPKAILFEIGNESQARRVLQLYFKHGVANTSRVEVWRDWPDLEASANENSSVEVATPNGQSKTVPVRGSGLIRSLLIQCSDESDQDDGSISQLHSSCNP
ncbi:S-adenosyl-L-methionine-dependent methyltransferase [Ilyonectria robusta]|uniref:S-adenosyl-L-methionine-dependent methyltransferase n=1 Tax=Ilyonectria robusta TaxID=1079257 RepID=UPI001E8DB9B3|nr:S-adenosyl-L-methionine-dependent methyltransferase [Ilyonectria robusta]KAH8733525.1 S-adenosyl-L-methionine-dependent methyltransferase [Ilyonectria robusta]